MVEQAATDWQGKVNVAEMNVDIAPDTAASLGIMSIPATLFFKDGKEVGRLVGAFKKDKLDGEIRRLFGI